MNQSVTDTLSRLSNRFDIERHYFEPAQDWAKEIKTGITFETLKYGHRKIDEHMPYKQGQLSVAVGHTNVGKTFFILYLLSRIIDRKKLIIYSAENRIANLARYLIQFYFKETKTEDIMKHTKWLASRVEFIRHEKRFNHIEILTQFAKGQHRGFDADCIFIDPYNALDIKGGHEAHYDAIEDMRIFTQQTGKSIFLNCHTVTEAQRQKHDKHGAVPVPMMSDVEGGGKFPNKADDVFVLHRNLYHIDEEERYVTQVHVCKIRNKEAGGQPTRFDEPIRMKFKKDWTGFDNDYDTIDNAKRNNPAMFFDGESYSTLPF